MSSEIKPWAQKAFELLFHAESHFRAGTDYDKRLALISFDNSIEVSITIYLNLHPSQRDNKTYEKKEVQVWLSDYPSKLDFFRHELKTRGLPERKGKGDIVWLHQQRNDLYHGSTGNVPALSTLDDIRFAALWIFSILFDITELESLLNDALERKGEREPTIPDEYAKPAMSDLSAVSSDPKNASALACASLIGKWDESKPGDMEIVRRLANEF